jgi:Ser/Thr protein kinase RdoA (MazF antagonist)
MPPHSGDLEAREVLRRYTPLGPVTALIPQGSGGGFSGARIWRVETIANCYCLKLWPAGPTTPSRLGAIHDLMNQAVAAGLTFVPCVVRTVDGLTWVPHAGRLWDLCSWMPGQADFCDRPSPLRLASAGTALAQLHAAWARVSCRPGPLPAVERRRTRLGEWNNLLCSGWRPVFSSGAADPVRPWAEQAWRLLHDCPERVASLLEPWTNVALPLHACLCDIWHDNVLFERDRVTGLIDYGSVKTDHVAVDLARLLGSLAGEESELRAAGLEAYRRIRPLSLQEEALVAVLDETGLILAAMNWLVWLYHEQRTFENRAAVARRLAGLVNRLATRFGGA